MISCRKQLARQGVEVAYVQFVEALFADSRLCTGCRACEVACSLRRTRQQDPYQSLITVKRDDSSGSVEIEVSERCDVCADREVPLCIGICFPKALYLGRKVSSAQTKQIVT